MGKQFYKEIKRINIKIFTYKDCLTYQEILKYKTRKITDKIAEDSKQYILGSGKNIFIKVYDA